MIGLRRSCGYLDELILDLRRPWAWRRIVMMEMDETNISLWCCSEDDRKWLGKFLKTRKRYNLSSGNVPRFKETDPMTGEGFQFSKPKDTLGFLNKLGEKYDIAFWLEHSRWLIA